ncbi:sulfatase-modifying factor protein [Pseudoxanthomonas broegbernensis]|uniref:Sulfatase-modifying factor protein n=1 Tax=Pseudoxanthomonas broegbernensis TaxID=83619 RepID=A0A7V8K6N9_9GAMM|nr:formylglycine-generating enzyme family protein [Pseudoxanthomonas broegbernensis]KAF1685852.1 sulfatase-modifying factor protein [Pseudoxanthomonas broegbernensis]MBB6064066.1 formylglycine-generating enzyme required for sulfatase activity [Pseudoxanthomonas broegbernensis]
MTSSPYRFHDPGHAGHDHGPQPVGTEYKFSHVTTGRYFPTPGKWPAWPFSDIGGWMVDAQASSADWLQELKDWRREHLVRIGYTDHNYRRPELQWAQRNFVHAQMMVEDRYFYDPVRGEYTVDRYLDDLVARYGGIDSVLIWYVYPNIGVDDRNQFDLAGDMPGGLEGLRRAVDAFHARGVKVFLPAKPWDHGTRDPGCTHWDGLAEVIEKVGADGINGDTFNGVPHAFFDACLERGRPVVLQPESTISAEEQLIWNVQSWGKKAPDGPVPPVSKWKWLEPRHMVNYENRWGRDRTHDLQYCFLNGIGYNAWENIWGIWNGFTARDGEVLRRIATIYRQFPDLVVSMDWEPYQPCLQKGAFASRFPGRGIGLWTLANRNEYALDGEQLALVHAPGRRYYDAWHGTPLQPRIEGERAVLSFALERRGLGAVLAVDVGVQAPGLDAFLDTVRRQAGVPLSAHSATWKPLPQSMVEVAPTPPSAQPPQGMVAIPAGEFDFAVGGIEIEGFTWAGVDVQFPWEDCPRRHHRRRMSLPAFHIDRHPVTNAGFKAFLDATGYRPGDGRNFLLHWEQGRPRPGWENKPVTWVSLEDARAYAAWAGKRLPRSWEWQYAAQGSDGRAYPWGDAWDEARVPRTNRGRRLAAPDDVDAHPDGASPFGVMDLVGNVWQWTDEFVDEHTRAAILRGGSSYQPQTSHWYFPQAYRLDQHGKYLLMAPCKDRSGTIGFRCVVDAA